MYNNYVLKKQMHSCLRKYLKKKEPYNTAKARNEQTLF